MKIGIIGAGAISVSHITAYIANSDAEIVAIADINKDTAESRAKEYNIPAVYTDYNDILNDPTIDAVSIVTPTFTHKSIVIEALSHGKHVLCEKPPALNSNEVKECKLAAEKSGKLLMYALVCRFRSQVQYLKNYIDAGKMGEIRYAEVERTSRCSPMSGGWFLSKSRAGGGVLFDCAIHELDLALYMMGYPKVKSVTGSVSYMNQDLPSKIKGIKSGWVSSDTNTYKTDIETSASGYITLDNGAHIIVKAGNVTMSVDSSTHFVQICGERAGAKMRPGTPGKHLELVEVEDSGFIKEVNPVISDSDFFGEEINHFIDCCMGKTECICKIDEAITLLEILDAIYRSAEIGKTIYF